MLDLELIGAPLDPRYPADIARESLAAMQTRLPGYIPRNGSIDTVCIEAMALAAADVSVNANAIVERVCEVILGEFHQVPRSGGAKAVGEVTVTFDSATSTTIPAGTAFVLGGYGVEVLTRGDVVVVSATTAVLPCETASATSLVNGRGPGLAVDVLDYLPGAVSAAVTSPFTGGRDPESTETWIARARNRLVRITSSLVVNDQFTAFVLEDPRVTNATTIPAWDGVSTGTILGDGGHVTTVVYGQGGPLDAQVCSELEEAMGAIASAEFAVHVIPAVVSSVDVTTSVVAMPGVSADLVRMAVEDALRAYLNPQVWEFGATVRKTSLTALIAGVEGVDYVDTLSLPAADVAVGPHKVAAAGVLSVGVR